MVKKIIAAVAALLLAGLTLQAKVSLPSFFSDNIVLQQQSEVAVWGTTDEGAVKVKVSPSWTRRKYTATAGEDGRWFLRIPTPAAGGPFSITFSDGDKTFINDIERH